MQPFDAYEPCGSCHRHVKRREARCPFCGASRTATLPRAPRRIGNVSRAQWLVFGSTLVGMGCNGVVGSSGAAEGGTPEKSTAVNAPAVGMGGTASGGDDAGDAVDATLAEATRQAGGGPWGPPDASCPRGGAFVCRSVYLDAGDGVTCDRATQYCNGYGAPSCQPLSQLANTASFVDAGTCGSCPTCDCILPSNGGAQCTCFEDNFGGLTVSCLSQSGCYGSPPARFDRSPESGQLPRA